MPELIALAKKEPGKIAYASPGSGSSTHLAGELLKTTAGIEMVHVPYKGSGPAYPDVISGRVPLLIDALFSSMAIVKARQAQAARGDEPERAPRARRTFRRWPSTCRASACRACSGSSCRAASASDRGQAERRRRQKC